MGWIVMVRFEGSSVVRKQSGGQRSESQVLCPRTHHSFPCHLYRYMPEHRDHDSGPVGHQDSSLDDDLGLLVYVLTLNCTRAI